MPTKHKYNSTYAITSLIVGLVFLTLLASSLALSQFVLSRQLTSVAMTLDHGYAQRLLAAKEQMNQVQTMLQQQQANHCSEETITLLQDKLFKQNDQPVPWVRFNDEDYICSAIGRWPVPSGGKLLSQDIDGHGLVIGKDERTFNKQRAIYASTTGSTAKVFVPVQSADAINTVLANCQVCGGINIKINGHEWMTQHPETKTFSSVKYQAKNSNFSYRLFANEHAKNQLWLTLFLLLLIPAALLTGAIYLFRGYFIKLYWHSRFVSALKKEAFYLAYQPIIDTDKNQVYGVETLLRWRKKNGEYRETNSYIRILEQDSVMPELTQWMIKTALSELKSLLRSNQISRCSINISAKQIEHSHLLSYIQLLADSGYPVDQLCFEVTERQPIESIQSVREFIAGCKQLGCRIKLDDVGVGYGGGILIQQLDFDCLKINKAFTKIILEPQTQPFLIRSYIAIAEELEIALIAEGVENQAQALYLKKLGVYLHQGWFYSKALPATDLRSYLLNH